MKSSTRLRLTRRVFRHGRLLALALTFTVFYAVVSGVSLGMILPFVELLFSGGEPIRTPSPESLSGLEYWRALFEQRANAWFFAGDPRDALARVCAMLIAAFALKGIFGFLLAVFSVTLEERVLKDLRDDLFAHLQGLSMHWFSGRRAGELISRATNDVMVVRKAVSSLYRTLPQNLLLAVTYLAVVFLASWRLALLCCVVFPILAVIIGFLGRRIRRHSTRTQEHMGDLASVFQETIGGIRVVKAFGSERFAVRKFFQATERYLKSIIALRRVASLASPTAEFLGAIGAVTVLWAGGNQILEGTGLTAAWFVIFLAAMISLMQPVRALTQLHTHFVEGDAAAARIFEILDTVPAIGNRPHAQKLEEFREAIHFENVTFDYGDETPVLRDVNLKVARGEIVALVGPSGAGKSTLVDMIPRFHDPRQGRVTLDGVDLRDLEVSSLRRHLGIVTQETILFHDTIRGNIAYGEKVPDEERVVAAAKAANAHEFIIDAAKGYDTHIGERGLRLSGGERQRLAIARAIYRDPAILIFDEATSSLDSRSEAKVQEAIDRLMHGRTAVIIAHRLSTVRHADRIAVLEEGRLVEIGKHDELLAAGGLYARLCEHQFSISSGQPQATS